MENKELIKEIRTLYIIKNIFNYIKDNNFKFKLFFYSKQFQNKLDIKLIDYKEKYINKIGFNINNYLHKEYEDDNLVKKYDNFILEKKLNKKEFKNLIFELIINKKLNEIEEDSEKLIDMDSPLFEIISKTKNFENNYTIYISQKNIDDNNLKDDFRIKFDNLNKSNV